MGRVLQEMQFPDDFPVPSDSELSGKFGEDFNYADDDLLTGVCPPCAPLYSPEVSLADSSGLDLPGGIPDSTTTPKMDEFQEQEGPPESSWKLPGNCRTAKVVLAACASCQP